MGRPIKPEPPDELVKEPTTPAGQTVSDAKTQVEFRLPPGWDLSHRDKELSTFHLDARSAPRKAELRAVAGLDFNPFPASTFSGALFYLSVTGRSSARACAAQASRKPNTAMGRAVVGDEKFVRGHDQHGLICTESRDTVYTALRHGSCVRFDLAINSFCGGEVSGVKDMTADEMRRVEKRLEDVLGTVRFTAR